MVVSRRIGRNILLNTSHHSQSDDEDLVSRRQLAQLRHRHEEAEYRVGNRDNQYQRDDAEDSHHITASSSSSSSSMKLTASVLS